MGRLNLINTTLISLIITLAYGYLTFGLDFLNAPSFYRMLPTILGGYGFYFILSWILPILPYAIHSFIKMLWLFEKESHLGFKIFKHLWVYINVLLVFLILMEIIFPV